MLHYIRSQGHHWPNMLADCKIVVNQCVDCQRFNITTHGFHPLRPILAELPMDHVAIDLIGPMTTSPCGNNYVLVLVDACTRFIWLRAIQDKSALAVARALLLIFCDSGFPRILQSDNGSEFANKVIQSLLQLMQTTHRLSTPYHPRGNGLAERAIRTTLSTLRKLLHGTLHAWVTHLCLIQLYVNIKVHSLHGSSSFFSSSWSSA